MATYGFIGSGHIVEMLLTGLLSREGAEPPRFLCSDVSEERRSRVAERFGVRTTADNEQVLRESGVVVLAVRPQDAAGLLRSLAGRVPPGRLVISVMAAVPLAALGLLGERVPVVRMAPNPPAQVRTAITALAPNRWVTPEQMESAQDLAASLGRVMVTTEEKLDVILALFSPAPVFLFVESLVEAGVRAGLTAEESELVVKQATCGCMKMWDESKASASELRSRACTPGGISVEMLDVLERGGVPGAIAECVRAGVEKGARLARTVVAALAPGGAA
ncbi:MAG: pyrroline-5-carboxylate reductase [Firmicutes bacterium]|nr:pyrroline-5-carboxylate reductase [Bacillota bacterium]